ncbi:hypothetical protein F5884DRAFT_422790 [Xylogone sp. PMI_703]|nr:hypothetical protein F5884DRAFT_422790 [Xylogone sp. PMI_703]
MLSSQITIVSRTHNSSRLVRSRVANTVIRPSAITLGRSTPDHQQSRAFRLGFWSAYLDPSCQKEFQRHRRTLQRKYIQAVNRKLAWDGGYRGAYPKHSDLKGFMTSTWRGHVMRPAARWIDLNSWHAASTHSQPANSAGIEEVERSALDKLLNHKDVVNDYVRAGSQMIERGWNTLLMSEHKLSSNLKDLSKTLHQARNHHHNHTPEKSSKSKFAFHDGQSLEYEIDPITNRKVFKNFTTGSAKSDDKSAKIPVKKYKGYQSQFVEFMPPSINGSGNPTGETGKADRVNMSIFDMPAARQPVFEEYHSTMPDNYKPFRFNEPDGKPPSESKNADPLHESLMDYERRIPNIYGAFRYNEPDGKAPEQPSPVDQSLKEYDLASNGYKAFRYNEPDGKPPAEQDPMAESLNEYDNLAKDAYKPFRYNEPDGQPPEKEDITAKSLGEYDNLVEGAYKPFRFNEPDGKPAEKPDPLNESLRDYEVSSEGYKPFKYNEPDGRPPVHPDIVENELSNFHNSSYNYSGSPSRLYEPFDSSMDPQFNSFDISSARNKADELNSSTRRRELEEDFLNTHKATSYESEELAAVEKVRNTRKLSEDIKAEYQELNTNMSATRNRIDAKLAEIEETTQEGSTKHKLTGNFIHDFPEEFKTSWTTKGADGTLIPEQSRESSVQKAERTYIEGMASQNLFSRNPNTPRLQTSLDRSKAEKSHTSVGKAQIQSDPYSKEPQGLETAYDEECGNGQPVYMSSYEPQGSDKTASTEEALSDMAGPIVESRNQHEKRDGGLSREPNAENVEGVNKDASVTPEQPNIYKILAYDPATQSISSAETTSVVPDLSNPLTPAEALLRLSNPTKFLPHLETLKQKGFEIVSGNDDVLVFRKIRNAAPFTSEVTITGEIKRAKMRVTNPIDGMTTHAIPATGNFASPTGFVNHDLPLDPAEYEPPFKSNIDVRREEPIFSGKSSWTDGTEGSQRAKGGKRRMKKVLVGATWVAGCTYAVGVVAEFFKTGGIDGKGPVGF